MKLALTTFALSVILACGTLVPASFSLLSASAAIIPASQLPATHPGTGRDEGTFLVTAADDGSRVNYFIADNIRHNVLPADMQVELQINPLWPVRMASRDEVLAFPEGAPVGAAKAGLITAATVLADESTADDSAVYDPAPEQPTAVAATSHQPTTYTLKPGDNLTRISAQYGTTIEALLAANGITNPNRIYVGQTLVVPAASVADSATADLSEPTVAEAPVDDVPTDDSSGSATYTVKAGDSAIGIARRFGVSVDDLLASNGVTNRNRVYVGQTLVIPGDS